MNPIDNIREMIRINTFTFVGVFDPNKVEPNFVYSVGVSTKGFPEVILIGNIHPAHVEVILSDLVGYFENIGVPEDGELVENILANGALLKVRFVDSKAVLDEYMTATKIIYNDVKVMQVMWPDLDGVFPDEEGYDISMKQPVLPA